MSLPGFRDFSAKTHKDLSDKGIRVVCSARHCGDIRAYVLDINGTSCIRTFSQVLELAS